jgi:hypothetical protein
MYQQTNHELCHRTDDTGPWKPINSLTMNSATTLMTSHNDEGPDLLARRFEMKFVSVLLLGALVKVGVTRWTVLVLVLGANARRRTLDQRVRS